MTKRKKRMTNREALKEYVKNMDAQPADEVPKQDRYGMPEFYQLLRVMAELHHMKSHDYASNEDPAGNYHFAGEIALMFVDPHDAGFAGRLAEKMYRMSNLQNSRKEPLNESVEDTERDFAVIAALWMADRKARRDKMRIDRKLQMGISGPPQGTYGTREEAQAALGRIGSADSAQNDPNRDYYKR